jgi:glycosyltransferase involved in cell wall biosynthesis
MPIVSVLIPLFNREHLIASTVRSAMSQTFRDIEIVVVDNQSSDASYNVVAELAEEDKRIKLFRNDDNVGPVRNWIRCTELASAPYSKLLFSDDLIAPSYLERTLPAILSPECGLVYTPAVIGEQEWNGQVGYRAFANDCKFLREYFLRATTYLSHFSPVSPGAALFRTEDLKKNIRTELPGVENYQFANTGAGVDWLIYVLTALQYPMISYIADPLCFFRAHSGSITIANEDNKIPMGYDLAKRWFLGAVKGL